MYLAMENIFPFLPDALSSVTNMKMPEVITIYSTGSYMDILKLRLHEYAAFRYINLIYYAPKVLSLFFLGYLFYKNKFLEKINNRRTLFLILAILFLIIGIIINTFTNNLVIFFASSWKNPYSTAIYMGIYEVANIFLGFAYMLIIITLSRVKFFALLLQPLKYIGRTALSNYLTQTIIFTTIMYGYGFGKFASYQPYQLILFAVGLFIMQIIISAVWLKYHSFGPVEWIWRKWMYLNMRQQKE